MALTTASGEYQNAMKIDYLPALNDTVVRKRVILNRLEKNEEDVEGRFAYVALISARNPAVGARSDAAGVGPKLPQAGKQSYEGATFPMAYHYGRGAVSGPVMRASKTDKGAFAKALDVEMRGLSESLPDSLNRMLWAPGHGRAATLNANQSASTVITVDATAYFMARVGDRVHIANITDGAGWTPANGTTITAISRDSSSGVHSITLAATTGASVTATADAMYFGADTSSILTAEDSSRANTPWGIPAAVDDRNVGVEEPIAGNAGEFINGTLNYGGIERSANVFWQAQRLHNSGTNRPLTVGLMEEGYLTYSHVGGGDEQSLEIYSNPGIWSTFGLLHIGDRRYNDYQETFENGFLALKYNGRPFFADRDAPRDIIWFLDMSTLMLLSSSGYDFMDEEGHVLKYVQGRDAWEFALLKDLQLGCRNCQPNVRLDDIIAVSNIESNLN